MEFELDAVAGDELRFVGRAGDAAMAVGQFHPIGAVLENFNHRALRRDLVGVEHGSRKFEVGRKKEEVFRSNFSLLPSTFLPQPAGR